MSRMKPRPYQARAIENLGEDLAQYRAVLAVSPTGSGKTVIAAMLIGSEPRWKRVLWIAHRYELVDQAYRTLKSLGLDVGIVMAQEEALRGSDRVNESARVQVASVQTIAARGVPDGVDLIVFDEAHRVMADSYQAIAATCDGSDVLGLTATPCRMDGKGLGEFFAFMRIIAQPSDLQADGHLAKPRTFSAPPDVLEALENGLKGARSSMGDYSPKSMSKAVDRKALIGKVVDEAMRLAPDVPKVVFACSVKHSIRLAEEFARKGVSSRHLDGKTPADVRELILAGLESGSVEVVCNVDVLSEGWDLPSLGAVVVARPTKSKARFLQIVGRVQRAHGKDRPLVIDHGANVQRLDLLPGEDIAWELKYGVPGESDTVHRLRVCEECGAAMERGENVCECGAEREDSRTPAQEREEVEAKLEEVTRADLASDRARKLSMARKLSEEVGAPDGWAEKVVNLQVGE